MKPVAPTQPHENAVLVTFAENQQHIYNPLTASVDADGLIMSEWELSDDERAAVAKGARIRLWMHTCRPHPLPPLPMPVQLEVGAPQT